MRKAILTQKNGFQFEQSEYVWLFIKRDGPKVELQNAWKDYQQKRRAGGYAQVKGQNVHEDCRLS